MNKLKRPLPQTILEFHSKESLENYLKNLTPERVTSSCVTVVNPNLYIVSVS